MLEKIKQAIQSVPNITFDEYFIMYMLSVQDRNIESEVNSTFKHVGLDVSTLTGIDHLIHKTHERLNK